MRRACDRARAAILEQELGPLSPDRTARLARHLAGCAACRGLVDDEARLTARLGAIALDRPPSIEVRARVLREIATRRPAPERSFVGWAAAIAAIGLVVLLGWSVAAWPEMRAGLSQARAIVEALGAAAWSLVSALGPIGVWLFDLVQAAARAVGSLAPLARAALPVATTLLAAGAAAAMATIAFAVARDLVRPDLASVEDP